MSEQVMEMMSLLRQINMRLHHCLKELYEPLGLTGPQAVVMIELFKEDGQLIRDCDHQIALQSDQISLKMTAEELDEINSGLRKLNEFLDREDL